MAKILLINRVFPPTHGATGRLAADVAESLAMAGHNVTILCEGLSKSLPHQKPSPNLTLHRSGHQIQRNSRLLPSYCASLFALWRAARHLPPHDLVITMTDPPLLAALGLHLGRKWGCKTLHWCQDMYPDILPHLGVKVPAPILKLARHIMARILQCTSRIIAIGDCMRDRLLAKNIAPDAIQVIPNWPEPEIQPMPAEMSDYRRALGTTHRIVLLYAGTIGLAHPLDGLLAALRDAPDCLLLLVGQGRGMHRVIEQAARLGIANLRSLPPQPREKLNDLLACADIHIAAMPPDAVGLIVPSKFQAALAAGRPCLFLGSHESHAARLLLATQSGLCCHPDDVTAITAALRSFSAAPDSLHAISARAAQTGQKLHHHRRQMMESLATLLPPSLSTKEIQEKHHAIGH